MSNRSILIPSCLAHVEVEKRAKQSLEEGICYITGKKLEAVGTEGGHEGVKKTINHSKLSGISVLVHPRFA